MECGGISDEYYCHMLSNFWAGDYKLELGGTILHVAFWAVVG